MNYRNKIYPGMIFLSSVFSISQAGLAENKPQYLLHKNSLKDIFISAAPIDEGSSKKKRPKNEPSTNDDDAAPKDESHNIYATVTPWGVSDGIHRGIDAGYFFRSDFSLGLRGEISQRESFNYDSWSAGIVARKFFGRSFYLSGGLKARVATRSCSSSDCGFMENGIERLYTWQYSDQGAEIAIGNQWRIKNLIVGCDWIGFYAPILKSRKSEIDPPASGSDVTEERKDNNVFSGQSYVRIASIYAGLIW